MRVSETLLDRFAAFWCVVKGHEVIYLRKQDKTVCARCKTILTDPKRYNLE